MRTFDSKADQPNRDLGGPRALLGCILACLTATLGFGAGSAPVVTARALLATDAAHPASSVRAAVVAQVTAGFHINDHKPTLDYLIPTELKLEPTKELRVEKVVYPKGESRKFEFSDTPLSVYEGTFVVGAILKVASTIRPGTYAINGKFAYQACNDHACLPPASVPLSLIVKVVSRSVSLKRVNADVFDRIQFE
jgi:cytochrome c biogenesis DsbD-like protein